MAQKLNSIEQVQAPPKTQTDSVNAANPNGYYSDRVYLGVDTQRHVAVASLYKGLEVTRERAIYWLKSINGLLPADQEDAAWDDIKAVMGITRVDSPSLISHILRDGGREGLDPEVLNAIDGYSKRLTTVAQAHVDLDREERAISREVFKQD